MNETRLINFIKGSASKSEAKEVIDWIEASEQNRREFNTIKNLWAITPPSEYLNQTHSLSLMALASKITGQNRRTFVLGMVKYAAALIFILLASSITFLSTKSKIEKNLGLAYQTITSPPGQTSKVTFPDGSVATLNSGSSISYSADYEIKKRSIKLKGEAMFEVETNQKIPFTVEARGIVVTATGTSFNVNAYSSDKEVNITLVEGSVNLSNTNGRFLSKMEPGENARIDASSNKLNISEVDIDYYISWQRGIIMFTNKSLGEIALDLEKWYNVIIIFSDQKMKEIKYSGAIMKNKPIDQVLEILNLTSNFEYEMDIKDNKVSVITIK